MTATYIPFSGDYGSYGASPEHPWFSYNQPQQVNVDPNAPAQTSNGGFLGSGFPISSGGSPSNSVVGFLNSLSNNFDPGGVGVAGVGGTPGATGGSNSSGPSTGTNSTSAGFGNLAADAISIGMQAMGLPSLGLAPAIANMLGLTSSINQPGIATVDQSTNNVNADLANIANMVQAAANTGVSTTNMGSRTADPTGVNASTGRNMPAPNQSSAGSPSQSAESPGNAAGGPGASAGTSDGVGTGGGGGQSDNSLKRGGFIRRFAEGGDVEMAAMEGDSLPWMRIEGIGEDAVGTDPEGRRFPMNHPAWVKSGSLHDRGLYPYQMEWEDAQRRHRSYKRIPEFEGRLKRANGGLINRHGGFTRAC